MATTEPAVGDPVILRGRILKLEEGVALVEVYRSYPVGGTVAVQCGALELDERTDDGGAVKAEPSDEDRIRDAMAEAQDHPGRTVVTCTQHGVVNCPCLSAPAGGSAGPPSVNYPRRIVTR